MRQGVGVNMVHKKELILWLVCLLLTVSSLQAFGSARFSGGDTFEAIDLEADITVSCQEGMERDVRYVTCSESLLNPGEYTYFVGPEGVVADTVKVKSTWENGKGEEKQASYDNDKGRSGKALNLWISTLLQRPLLDYGVNKIDWEMSQSGQTVASGTYDVKVVDKGTRRCPSGYYSSWTMNDCRFPSSVCDRHFRSYNYCE